MDWPPTTFSHLLCSERHREAKMQNTAGVVSRTKLSVFDSPLSSRVEDTLHLELARSGDEAEIKNKYLIANLSGLFFGRCLIRRLAVRLRIGFRKSALGRDAL